MKRPAFAGSTLSPIRLLPGASAHPAPFWPFMCRQARSSSSAPPSMMAAAISTPGRDIGIQPAPTARPPTVTATGPRARQRRPARRLSAIGSKVGPVRARAPRAIRLGCTGPSGKQALQESGARQRLVRRAPRTPVPKEEGHRQETVTLHAHSFRRSTPCDRADHVRTWVAAVLRSCAHPTRASRSIPVVRSPC